MQASTLYRGLQLDDYDDTCYYRSDLRLNRLRYRYHSRSECLISVIYSADKVPGPGIYQHSGRECRLFGPCIYFGVGTELDFSSIRLGIYDNEMVSCKLLNLAELSICKHFYWL